MESMSVAELEQLLASIPQEGVGITLCRIGEGICSALQQCMEGHIPSSSDLESINSIYKYHLELLRSTEADPHVIDALIEALAHLSSFQSGIIPE